MGFNLSKASSFSLSEFLEMRSSCQLVKVYVRSNSIAQDLSKGLELNPNYFEVTDQAANGVVFVARTDMTESVVSMIAEAYARKHGLMLDGANADKVFWQTAKKLSQNDPECLVIGREIRKRVFDPENPLSVWNDKKIMLGISQLNFVNFSDFNPAAAKNAIPLDCKIEDYIYYDAYYRIKNKEKLVSLLQAEAKKLNVKLTDISPIQAIQFSAYVVERALNYDYRQLADLFGQGYGVDALIKEKMPLESEKIKANDTKIMEKLRGEGRIDDELGADELLQKRSGVCRHYATAFNAIFYTLKTINPKLANIYTTGMSSELHEWILVLNIERGNRITAAMIDPTADDEDNIFGNDLDATDEAGNKYATASLLLRIGRNEEFRKLFNDNSHDPEFQIFMLSNLAQRVTQMQNGAYEELERLAPAAANNHKCDRRQVSIIRNILWSAYVSCGKFDKALSYFDQEKNELRSYVDPEMENLFYATLSFNKGEFSRAELFARKCKNTLEAKQLLGDILFAQKRDDEALAVYTQIYDAYDHSEYKLSAGMSIAEILAKKGMSVKAQDRLSDCQKLCRTRNDRFQIALSLARVGCSVSNGVAEGRYRKILSDYSDIFNEIGENIYLNYLTPGDISYLSKIALSKYELETYNKLIGLLIKQISFDIIPGKIGSN